MEAIRARGLGANLVDLGYLPHDEVTAEQTGADILILPLRQEPEYAKVLPGKIFEYLAAGRPVLGIGQEDGAAAEVLRTRGGEMFGWDRRDGLMDFICGARGGFRIREVLPQGLDGKIGRTVMKKEDTLLFVHHSRMLVLSYAYVQVLDGKIVNQSDISGWQGMSKEMMDWNAGASRRPGPPGRSRCSEACRRPRYMRRPTATGRRRSMILLTGRRPATYLSYRWWVHGCLCSRSGCIPRFAGRRCGRGDFLLVQPSRSWVGHNTKMQAIAFLPGARRPRVYLNAALKKKKWLPLCAFGAAMFALFVSFPGQANHPQITYYLALMILLLCADAAGMAALAQGKKGAARPLLRRVGTAARAGLHWNRHQRDKAAAHL